MSLEAQLRRVAKREGYVIGKSRRRNPQALDYGKYWLSRRLDKHRNLR